MPAESVEEAVEMTNTHLDHIHKINNELQQFSGRIESIQSILAYIQENDGVEVDIETLTETQAAAETMNEIVDHWIEETVELREVVQTSNTLIHIAQMLTNSLSEIDEDLPERITQQKNRFESIKNKTQEVHDYIALGLELLEELIVLLIDIPQSEETIEMARKLTQHHEDVKETLDI